MNGPCECASARGSGLGSRYGGPASAARRLDVTVFYSSITATDFRRAVGDRPGPRCAASHPRLAEAWIRAENARSVGFRLSFAGFRFLDLGDLTWNVEHPPGLPERNLLGPIDVRN